MRTCPQCSASYPDDYAVCPKDGAALQDASLWQVNTVIRGRYKILALIGEGGMATVYKAHHQLLDELRALKVIKPELARDASFVQRFKNEAIITRKLQHPNAVRVDDLDIAEDGRPFISMELVEGESLKSFIQRSGALDAPQTLEIALQVCQALDAAHALGLIHRDIKPDNIYLMTRRDAAPLAKVLDFGIARLKEDAPGGARLRGMTLTGTGVVIGTPEYMSPEQAMGKHGEQLDGRSDLYSLGIVMYRMLAGELPFKADTTVEMILHHIQTVPQPPQSLKPGLRIPDEVSGIVMKALEKDREKRFASAGSMAQAIRQAQESGASAGAPATLPPSGMLAATVMTQVPKPSAASAQPATPSAAASARPEIGVRHGVPFPPAKPAPQLRRPALQSQPPTGKKFPTLAVMVGVAALAAITLVIAHRRRSEAPPAQPPQPAAQAPQPQATAAATAPQSPGPEAPRSAQDAGLKPGATPTQPNASEGTQPQPSPPSPNAQPSGPGAARTSTSGSETKESGDDLESEGERQGSQTQPGRRAEAMQLSQQGRKLFQAGKYRLAAQKFRRILEINPNNKFARNWLERCQEKIRERKNSE